MKRAFLLPRALVAALVAVAVAWVIVVPCRDHDCLDSTLAYADGLSRFSSENAHGEGSYPLCAICVSRHALAHTLLATGVSLEASCPVSFVPARRPLFFACGSRWFSDPRAPPHC